MDILFTSPFCPGERTFGSDTRNARVLRRLCSSGHRVHFVHLTRKFLRGPFRQGLQPPCVSFHSLHVAGCSSPGVQPLSWKQLTRRRSFILQRYWSNMRRKGQSVDRQLRSLILRTRASILWVDHAYLAPILASLPSIDGMLRIVDTHDVMHLRDASLRAAGLPSEHDVSREEERRLLSKFDLVVAIQDQERDVLQQLLAHRRVITLGHAAAVEPQPCDSLDICFVGSNYLVNEHSLREFLAQAWLGIRARCPATKLRVVGAVCERPAIIAAARRDSRIVLRGIVSSSADMHAGPAVVVCPLWAGSGLKIKMVEALAHGKAIVASPVAVQGLSDGIGTAFELARDPADFIEPVVRLIGSATLRQQLEQRAAEYAAQKFNEEFVWREMDKFLCSWQGRRALAKSA
jgi:glycosyltransferase involved in cell wall biosynthesis